MNEAAIEKVLKRLGGRKFALVFIVGLFTSIYTYMLFLSADDFMSIMKMLLLTYPASAIGQSFLLNKTPAETKESLQFDMRKFGFSLVIFFVGSFLFYSTVINGSNFVELCHWVVGVYLVGNVATKAVDAGVSVSIKRE